MKVVDTHTLKKIVAHARERQFNRLMSKAAENQLDPNGHHILSQAMIHGDVQCIRCNAVLCKMKDREEPYSGVLDITLDDWSSIPEHEPVKV